MWRSDPASLPFNLGDVPDKEVFLGTDEWRAGVFLGTKSELPRIQPLHACLSRHDGGWFVAPKDGIVFVNRDSLAGSRFLEDGDCILLPGLIIQYWGGRLENVPLPEQVAKSDNLGSYMDELGQSIDVCGLSDERGGLPILSNVSFAAKDGEFIGILGPSGCGKSSLIQRMAGLADWKTGDILYDKVPLRGNNERLRHLIAYVPQEADACLHGNLSVWQEVECHMRLRAARSNADEARKRTALVSMGLWEQRRKRVGDLSGGQRRRLSISLALLRRPQLLLLDEPTSGLDPTTEASLMQYLRKLSKQGCTVVCSTHMLANIDLFTHILVLNGKGAMDQWCGPDEVVRRDGSLSAMYDRLARETRPPVPPGKPFEWLRKEFRLAGGGSRSSKRQVEIGKTPSGSPPSPAWWRAVGGYILRNILDLVGAAGPIIREPKWNGKGTTLPRRGNSVLLPLDHVVRAVWAARTALWLFVIQPMAMSVAIRFAIADKFTVGVTDYTVASFCAALSAFWLGMSHAARLLVGERVPGRCLERLDGVSVARYISAQFLWCGIVAILQVLFFVIPYFAWKTFPSPPVDSYCWQPTSFFTHWLVLALVHVMGGAVGLFVSALARRETTAISCIPLAGMVILLLGAPVLGIDPHEDVKGHPLSQRLACWVMPCTPAEKILDLTNSEYAIETKGNRRFAKITANGKNNATTDEWWSFLGRFSIYVALSFFLAYHFQKGNEYLWEGR